MIRGDQIEHAVVHMNEPDVGLGAWIDRLLATPSETVSPSGMSMEELNYLLISTAPDGQWADQAVHSYCTAIRALKGKK